MGNTFRAVSPPSKTGVLPAPASTAIEIGDLLYWDDSANTVKVASAQADQGSEPLNQELFRENFIGVALQQRLATQTSSGNIEVAFEGEFEFDCPSTTWEIGDLVGASEAGSGTALLDQQVEKVTANNLAIGFVTKRTTAAVTTVTCRLFSSWASDLAAHRSGAAAGALVDLDGLADGLVLDADGDTTISAPTDDQMDFEVGGGDVLTLTATAFTFAATCYPVLPVTSSNGTVEGSIWYDSSVDKLKFKTAAGVETVTST